jgi:hypothetical protein
MTLIQLIRALRWLKTLDDRPTRSDDGARCSQVASNAITARQLSAHQRRRETARLLAAHPTSTRC